MSGSWLLYGAYGYTGRLIAREAKRLGMKPVLAGRRAEPLRKLSKTLALPHRVLSLADPDRLARALDGFDLVLHCAGPFSRTGRPMMAACLKSGTHYLDLTGEIPVFEQAWKFNRAAREVNVCLLPGVGFDVVPTDCLALNLYSTLPDAHHLTLAFQAQGGPSPGTARTSIESLAMGGRVRENGRLRRVPLAWQTREFRFKSRPRKAITIPWGDVFTAYFSTHIPNIRVYMSVPDGTMKRLRQLRWVQPLLKLGLVQRWLQRRFGGRVTGPDEGQRKRSFCYLYGEARNPDGRRVSARMVTPNGYTVTVNASLGIVRHALEHGLPAGFRTPGQVMGADFARGLRGVEFKFDGAPEAEASTGTG